jgi:hypothetical protein
MRLLVTDYSETPELEDAVGRYYTLLQMTFESNVYKLFETPTSEIFRFMILQGGAAAQPPMAPGIIVIDVLCDKCGKISKVQANVNGQQPLQPGSLPFPADSQFPCPNCGNVVDLAPAKQNIEKQVGKIVT